MLPIIDVHEHIFSGRDIPLEGYLRSRAYPRVFRFFANLLAKWVARCIRRRHRGGRAGILCHVLLAAVYLVLGPGYRRWARILSETHLDRITALLLEEFEEDGIGLFVPLMIDFEYWFHNTVDRLVKEQIDLVAATVVEQFGGKVHPFVPFDPVRELAFTHHLPTPDDRHVETEQWGSMALVKKAILEDGFLGVKLYHSLGYRPTANASVDDVRRRHFEEIGFHNYLPLTGEEIDAKLDELYQFCLEEQVPITVHCGSDGIESFPGASYVFGSPSHWIPVLEHYPDLHLNLAHFGWSHRLRYSATGTRRWGRCGRGLETSWLRTICEMLKRYPNLYTDVAHHEVLTRRCESRFLTDYRAMCADFPGVIQKKLLFGIDWHVITRLSGYRRFPSTYRHLLGGLFSPSELEDFFGGNALRFLGLLPVGTGAGDGWSKNRERLRAYYAARSITPPAWFTLTD
jgi:predicted TIM-barrel fold metal-dependent hydrolase